MKRKLYIALIPVLVLLIGCMSLLVMVPDSNGVYVEQIRTARQLCQNGDYQKAIVYYKEAIKHNDTSYQPYKELAQIYMVNMKDVSLAMSVLNEGYRRTGAPELHELIAVYTDENGTAPNGKSDAEEMVAINSSSLEIFSTYTYEKYSQNCTVKNERTENGKYTVEFRQYNAVFEFENTAGKNNIVDIRTGKPFKQARPTLIKIMDSNLIGTKFTAGTTMVEIKDAGGHDIKINEVDSSKGTYRMTFTYRDCAISLNCNKNGVLSKNSYISVVPKQGTNTGSVIVRGEIVDVTSGTRVETASLVFREGKSNKFGDTYESYESTDGTYSVNLNPGDYTVEVDASGYNKEYYALYVTNTGSDVEKNFSVSTSLNADEIRFVLEWGSSPRDLDSHLEGKTAGKDKVNISFRNRSARNRNGETIAKLDVDDIDGFGPETTTLSDTSGEYVYKIHRFSRYGSIASSGVTIKIYLGSSSTPIVIEAPDDVGSEWWTVCKVKNGKVVDINGKIIE